VHGLKSNVFVIIIKKKILLYVTKDLENNPQRITFLGITYDHQSIVNDIKYCDLSHEPQN